MQHQDFQLEFPPHLQNRFDQVGIIRDNHRRLIIPVEGIHQQIRRQVDIRALLFRFQYLDGLGPARQRVCQGQRRLGFSR